MHFTKWMDAFPSFCTCPLSAWERGKRDRKCGLFSAAFFSICFLLQWHQDNGEPFKVCACVNDENLEKEEERDNA